jgi:arylsulfatase A-like enzyme
MTHLIKIVCLLSLLALGAQAAAQQKPNVIFILADDLGWADTTLYGHTSLYETPNLERLARRGMTFTRACANSPLCSPTRASILTGQTPARHGSTAPTHHTAEIRLAAGVRKTGHPHEAALLVQSVSRLDTRFPTLGKLMNQAGYATGHFGKWHLGTEPYSPLQHGFDVDIPHWPGPGPAGSFVAPWRFKDFKANTPNEHIEDRMAKEAVQWMKSLPNDKPFFMNYWQFSVHAPFNAKTELIEKYRGKIDRDSKHHSPTYASMVESLDDAIGTLLDAVDEADIADRTIFVFTSDNGGNMYSGIPEKDKDGKPFITAPTSNRPLRGGKACIFEGGIRVPTIVAWPGLTKVGTRSDQIIQCSDFYPTLLAGLGIPLPDNHVIDGIDITPALKGGKLNRDAIFTYFPHAPNVPDWLPPSVAANAGDWKLIRLFHHGKNGAHDYRLYNLKNDIGEEQNLASRHPDKVRELDRLIERHLTDAKAVTPKPNSRFDPAQFDPSRIGVQVGGLKIEGKKRAPTKKPNAKPIQGWRAGNTATLAAGNGTLILRSTGNDPQLVLVSNPGLSNGPFTVSIRLKTTKASKMLVFCNPPFKRGGFTDFGKVAAGRWVELFGRFATENLTGLRFDPLTAAGQAEIDWIHVVDRNDILVKEWTFQ